jgi:hypothetical protein
MYQLLKVMRFQLREFLRSVADSWQSVFASAEFLAAVTPDLPLKTAEDRRILITDLRRRSDAAPTEATNLFDGGAREENEDDVSFSDALCAGAD